MQPPLAVFPVDPGERFAEPGDEVVAPRLVAVPPAALDPLRAGRKLHLRLLYRERLMQEPCRPGPRRGELARIPVAGLDAPPGVLGTVVGHAADAVHRFAARAPLQPLDEPCPVLGLGGSVAEQAPARRRERREILRLERD